MDFFLCRAAGRLIANRHEQNRQYDQKQKSQKTEKDNADDL